MPHKSTCGTRITTYTSKMMRTKENFVQGSVLWRPNGQAVPIPFVTTERVLDGDHSKPFVLFHTGFGESGRSARHALWALGNAGVNGAVVSLPYGKVRCSDMLDMPREAPRVVADHLAETTAVNIAGSSRGGLDAILSAGSDPRRFGSVATISPAGITNRFLGKTDRQRRNALIWRLSVLNTCATRDPRLVRSQPGVWGEVAQHAMRGQLRQSLNLVTSDTVS